MAPHNNVSDYDAMWPNMSLTKFNCGNTFIKKNWDTYVHISPISDKCPYVTKCRDLWRHFWVNANRHILTQFVTFGHISIFFGHKPNLTKCCDFLPLAMIQKIPPHIATVFHITASYKLIIDIYNFFLIEYILIK